MKQFRILLAVVLALSGCSSQQKPERVASETVNKPLLPPIVNVAEVEKKKAQKPSAADHKSPEKQEPTSKASHAFEAPFPDRVELFVSPKRQGRGIKKSLDGNENTVELLGFIKVKDQRVVLSIDGLVSPLAVGSQEAGIEVISIQPPAVVLQRGRQRWQVSLEN